MILNNIRKILFLFIFYSYANAGKIEVFDETNQKITLTNPAQRIVVLAPHLVEILFSIGAGDLLVGAVEYSNYPLQAKLIPRVGGHILDIEAIVALKPDLVIAWKSGNSINIVEKLKALGLTVYLNESGHILDVPDAMEKLGVLTGTRDKAGRVASEFRRDYLDLQKKYQALPTLKVFYQIWHQPLMTINDHHLISDAINLCGGNNIFGKLNTLTPTVGIEAILSANPDAIIASGSDEREPQWLADWKRWKTLAAVKKNALFSIPPDLVQRPGPRILIGAKMICENLDRVRQYK